VKTIFPDLDIDTLGLKVPATLMHMHSINVTLETAPSADEVHELLAGEERTFLIPEHMDVDGAGKLKEFALDRGRPRGDIWENAIWGESISMEGNDCYLFQAIHQESDVVPENIDALRAVTGQADRQESMETTNEALGIGL
jgi:glyceraldehyde-3-phosphate dehydrogenase (NAD(P))